jgi:peptide/nickel transport system permease protein
MMRYLSARLILAIPTLIAVMLIVFTLTYISPFDPVRLMLLQNEVKQLDDPEQVARIRRQYGLDDPFINQFINYTQRLLQGDLGISINGQRNIKNMILATLPISAQLGIAAAFLTAVVGIPLGALAALKQNSWIDNLIVSGTLVLRTIPVYVMGPLLLILFVLVLHIMNVPRGWNGLFSTQTILPVVLLTFGPLAVVVRQTRQSVLEVFSQDYVRTAKAKGVSTYGIVVKHILRNALIPVVTALGFITEGLIVSSVFLDNIFAIPGFGSISENAFRQLDYPVIMGITLTSAILVILTNTLVDMMYPFLDPRVTLDS